MGPFLDLNIENIGSGAMVSLNHTINTIKHNFFFFNFLYQNASTSLILEPSLQRLISNFEYFEAVLYVPKQSLKIEGLFQIKPNKSHELQRVKIS